MPNTLAHFGIQEIGTRAVMRNASTKWIFVGCIIPDFPWILRRAVATLVPDTDPYDLRLYAMVQSSLVFCCLISMALALVTEKPRKTFVVLAMNSIVHLALDACQTKWGNGVHLFAPLSWKLLNFGFFWPESWITYSLTTLGLMTVLLTCRRVTREPSGIVLRWRGALSALLLSGVYFGSPFLFMNSVERSDSHFLMTLRDIGNRVGKRVDLDRGILFKRENRLLLETYAREELSVSGGPRHPGCFTVRATFVDYKEIKIHEFHEHRVWFRDGSSYIGLGFFTVVWVLTFFKMFRRLGRPGCRAEDRKS